MPLNDGFEGGGTQFVELEGAPIYRPAVGAALLFSGKNRHRGIATTEGVRYILAGFVDVRKGFVDKRKRSRSRSPPPSSPQSRISEVHLPEFYSDVRVLQGNGMA